MDNTLSVNLEKGQIIQLYGLYFVHLDKISYLWKIG